MATTTLSMESRKKSAEDFIGSIIFTSFDNYNTFNILKGDLSLNVTFNIIIKRLKMLE